MELARNFHRLRVGIVLFLLKYLLGIHFRKEGIFSWDILINSGRIKL